MRQPSDPQQAQRRDPIRAVGESYRDACDRLAGEKRAAEFDRDRALTTIDDIEKTLADAGRIWRAPDGSLVIQARDSTDDPDEFLPEGAVELVEQREATA